MIIIKEEPGSYRAFVHIENLLFMTEGAVRRTLERLRTDLVNTSRAMILDTKKTGVIYRWRGRTHQASAPGEAPANRSGALLKSIQGRVMGDKIVFSADTGYARYLEEGTTKMSARPYLRPSIAINEKKIKKFFYSEMS